MQSAKPIHFLHLHFIVLLWGFSGVLGKLISIDALPLVWFRVGLASILLFLFMLATQRSFRIPKKLIGLVVLAGITISVHWIAFFYAIKVSNVSITLACMSTGAFMTAFLEPLFHKRKIILYEVGLGLVTVLGLSIILKVQFEFLMGIFSALVAALLSSLYSLMNSNLIKKAKASALTFYQLFIGFVFLSVVLVFRGEFNSSLWQIESWDFIYLFVLALFCTAYAITSANKLLLHLSPYTLILTLNMEPVYGIILAYFVFGESETMDILFYIGALLIMISVVLDAMLKYRAKMK